MAFTGKFWLVWEEQPIDMDDGQVVELKDGAVLDGRTGEPRGTFTESDQGVEIVFDLERGEQHIALLRPFTKMEQQGERYVSVVLPFDPAAASFPVTWSTVRYEAYLALRPAIEVEDDELEAEREHAEFVLFGNVPTHGAALRDGPHILEMHEENQRESSEPTLVH